MEYLIMATTIKDLKFWLSYKIIIITFCFFQTPLHLAVLVNKPEIISVLLIAGANPNLLDRHGYTSVHISVSKQQHECMDTVFKDSKFPVSLNTRDYEGKYSEVLIIRTPFVLQNGLYGKQVSLTRLIYIVNLVLKQVVLIARLVLVLISSGLQVVLVSNCLHWNSNT